MWALSIAGVFTFQVIGNKVLRRELAEEDEIFTNALEHDMKYGTRTAVSAVPSLEDRPNYMKYRRLSKFCLGLMWTFWLGIMIILWS